MKTGRKLLASTLLFAAAMSFCTTSANAATLTWAGTDSSNSWNYTDTNWSNGSTFVSGDSATFDDTATNKDVSISGAITADTITVSSGSYTFTFSSKGSVTATSLIIDEGASLVMEGSGVFTDSYSVAIYGVLEISGGTATMGSYVNAYSGGTLKISGGMITTENMQAQNGGTIEITGGDTTILDTLYVRSGGALTLSGGTITLSSAISNSGTVTIDANSDVVFVLDNLTKSGDTYTIISGGTISGWDTLTRSNFLLNSSESLGHVSVDVSTAGKVTFKTGVVEDLIWDGTSTDSEWTNGGSENWLYDGQAEVFYAKDNVTFDTAAMSKSVSINEEITAGYVTISSGSYTFLFSDEGSVAASRLTVSSGASLLLSDNATLTVSGTTTINGTFVISGGETTFSGSITVRDGGMFEITGGETTISSSMNIYGMLVEISGGTTTISGSLYVGSGGALTLSGGTITLSSAISNSGTVTIDASTDVVFVLDNLTKSGNTYTIISGGTIEGWDTLTNSNFMLNGSAITARSVVDVSTKGQVKITDDGSVTDLVWKGTASSNVWRTDGEKIWEDSLGVMDTFRTGDTVTFGDDGEKTVSVVGAIEAGRITVSAEGYTFIFSDDASITASSMRVGYAYYSSSESSGTLNISGNGTTTLGGVYVGYAYHSSSESSGTLNISGNGTTTFSSGVYVGYACYSSSESSGTLNISGNGTTTFLSGVDVGYAYYSSSESSGTLNISGSGTTTFSSTVCVGYSGDTSGSSTGTIKISGGETTFSGSYVYIGYADGSTATGTIEISDSTTTFKSTLYVGYARDYDSTATGTIEISGGETTFSGTIYLGYAYSSSGKSSGTIEISDSTTTFKSTLYVGYYDTGTITISGGITTFGSTVYIGYSRGGVGTVNILDGTTTFGGVVNVGYADSTSSATGTLTIGSVDGTGGKTTFSSGVRVGYGASSSASGTGTIEIFGGETTFESWVYIGDATSSSSTVEGAITISGGTTTFSSAVYVGYTSSTSASATGTLEISGGEAIFESSVYICYSPYSGTGTLEISGGETTFSGEVYVGYISSSYASGTGTLEISGGTTTFSGNYVYVGYTSGSSASGTGTLEISGGTTTFSGSYVYIGYADKTSATSTGTLEISGGETTFRTVYLGYSSDSYSTATGTIAISGEDTRTTFRDIVYVGYGYYSNSHTTGTGTIEITDGSTTFSGTVYVGYGRSSATGEGTITISGGTTTFSSTVYVGYTSGSSASATGTLEISGGETTFLGEVTVRRSSTVTLSGGTITLSSAISNSGTVTVNDSIVFALDNLTSDEGTYTLISGGTIKGWDTLTKSSFSLDGSVISGRVTVDVSVDGRVTITEGGVADLVWNGTSSDNIWKTNGEDIWLNDGDIDAFASGDSVTFDDTAESKTVIVEGSVSTGSVTVKSGEYTFTGDGSITTESLVVDSGASLSLEGSGELTASSSEINGTLEISDGGVSVTDSLTSTGSISVSQDASLELSGTVDISSAISNEGTVTVNDSIVFVLDNLENVDGTYTIISGGSIEGWGDLTKSNFQLNGSGLGRATVDVSVDGQVTVIEGSIGDLVWNGTASSNVWTNNGDEIWLNGDDSDVFIENDNVTFGTDGEKSVSVVGAIVAGTVTVTGSDYTFTFSENSSVTADSLTIDSGASLTLAGSGELTTSSATVSGTFEITSGEATITTVEISSEGTLKVSGGTATADSIEVAGSIELTGGELTVKTITLSDGSGSFSGGILNIGEITGDGNITFGDGLTVNLYNTTSLNADITLAGNVTFNAEDSENIELSGALSGSGKLVKDGDGTLTLSGDNTYSGGTTISAGTVVAQSETALGSGSISIDDGATLQISTSREFTNATSGNGTLSIASGATVSFTQSVGTQTLEVASGATLSGATTLTHSNAQLILAGTLALDASAGEQVSFTNGGTVILEDSATLNLSGVSPTSVRPLSSSSEIGPGSNITIFSGATVEGDIEAFLAKDSTLSDLSNDYAVVYDAGNGLSVMILESGNVSSITSGVKLHEGIGSSFISAIISDDDLDFGTGIKSSDDLQSLSNPIVKALATGNISEASKMMDTLAPDDYAAMVAMPTTSFYNDVKAIDNRLAARRGPLDENARWEFFAQAHGTFIENDDANDTQTFDFDLYGVLAGADYRVNEGLTVGVTIGYDYGKADIHNSGGKIESDDVRVTIFAGQQIGEMFFVNAGAQVGYGHYEAKRKTAYGDAKGDTDGWNAGLFADVGMMLTLSEELKIAARPYVGLAYLHSEVGSFDDNLFDVDDFHGDSLRASIGCGLFWGFDLAEAAWTVGLDASYSHDFCGDEVDIDATYMSTGKDFGLTAKALSKDIFSLGPVVSVGLTKSIDIFAGYAFQVGTDSSTGHNLNAGLKVTF